MPSLALVLSCAACLLPSTCRGTKRRRGTGQLPQWKLRALRATREEGFRVEKYGSTGPELCFPDGTCLPIGHSLEGYQLCWRLQGCPRDNPHMRVSTSITLRDPCDLWCPFCMYSEGLWQQQGMRVLPDCELRLMQLLCGWGVDRE